MQGIQGSFYSDQSICICEKCVPILLKSDAKSSCSDPHETLGSPLMKQKANAAGLATSLTCPLFMSPQQKHASYLYSYLYRWCCSLVELVLECMLRAHGYRAGLWDGSSHILTETHATCHVLCKESMRMNIIIFKGLVSSPFSLSLVFQFGPNEAVFLFFYRCPK